MITPGVQGQAHDGLRNTSTGFTGKVTVAIETISLPDALPISHTDAAVGGVATFANLSIDKVGTGYTLMATGAGSATSAAFNITAGTATQLTISTPPPATAQSGVAFTPQPVLQLRDANGNVVSQAGTTVTAVIATGPTGATLTNAAATTTGSGAATFNGLAVSGSVGGYTLRFESGTLTAPTSGTITLSAGAAATLARNAGGTSAPAGTAVSPPPSVIVKDASGNPVGGVAVTFTPAAGSGTVTPTTPVSTGTDGIAALTSWTLSATAGQNTLTATSSGLTGSPVTFTATGTAGPSATMAKSSGDNLTGQVATRLQTPHVVLVSDANGNPVSGVTVTWAAASGGGSVDPATSTTDANGNAQTFRTLGLLIGKIGRAHV